MLTSSAYSTPEPCKATFILFLQKRKLRQGWLESAYSLNFSSVKCPLYGVGENGGGEGQGLYVGKGSRALWGWHEGPSSRNLVSEAQREGRCLDQVQG